MLTEQHPAPRLEDLFADGEERPQESGEDHRNRLFAQVLLSLALNIVALMLIFYFLLPLSDLGRDVGGMLLQGVFGLVIFIRLLFWKFGNRSFCVNLLLLSLSLLLVGSSFTLGGVSSPTMIFMVAIPVLAATMMQPRWAFFWTAATVAAWLLVVVLESSGLEVNRVTIAQNVGMVQAISLAGTLLVVMGVLASYVASNSRLRSAMQVDAERLDYLASHDPLTHLPNRRAFFAEAQLCLLRASRVHKPFALLVIDLNDFKRINDKFGHTAGDTVLEDFAGRMKRGFRECDFVGRLGGDEFGVLLQTVEDQRGVDDAIARFFAERGGTLETLGKSFDYHCAIGSAIYPHQGTTLTQLYDAADAAMYKVKREKSGGSIRLLDSA